MTYTNDQVYKALEKKTGLAITALHEEANKYAFKDVDGIWHSIDKDFIHDAIEPQLRPIKTPDWWNDLYTDASGNCFTDSDSGL